jgi:hypothetical protein
MHLMATRSTWSCFASTHPSRWCHVSSQVPVETTPLSFEAQTQWNPPFVALGGFEAQPPWVAYLIASPMSYTRVLPVHDCVSNMILSTRPHVGMCPRCQPSRLVTWILWSLGQVLALVLRHSRSIDTNQHDLHLFRRPSSLCSTPTHHKPRDIVAQHIISYSG